MSYLRKFCLIHSHKDLYLFSSKSLRGFVLILGLWSILSLFLCMMWRRIQVHFFARGYQVVQAPFVEKTILSYFLDCLITNQLTININVYFSTLSSFLSVGVPICIPASHYSDYCCFVLSFEIEKYESSSFVLLFLRLAVLSPLSSLIHFRISL